MPRLVTADIANDVATSFATGAKSAVGTTAVQMVVASNPATKGVLVKADSANAGIVYVGKSNGVTHGTADATDGFPLSKSDSILVPVTDANLI